MDEVQCMVDDCTSTPDDELTIDSKGLRLVCAVCTEHAQDIRWGTKAPSPADSGRGLIGLA